MIEQITIENFKSLKKVQLKLGRMNLFVGSNASGKSNLFDALRVLRGVAGGFPIKELFEGGTRTGSGEAWPGIRGGLRYSIHMPTGAEGLSPDAETRLSIGFNGSQQRLGYIIGFNAVGKTTQESLYRDGEEVFLYDGKDPYFRAHPGALVETYPHPFLGSQLILAFRTGLAGAQKPVVEEWIRRQLSMQFFEFVPDVLRRYGTSADLPQMGELGENFASLVRAICSDPATKEAYLTWLRELRPRELDDVTVLKGAVGEPLIATVEAGRTFPAPVLSDGTLRFAALAAAFFQPAIPEVVAIEEIENGIHASRLRILLQLLRSRAGQTTTQVMATTHSPLLLDWLTETEWETTFFCHREPETGATVVLPLTELPGFRSAAKPGRIGQLLAEGWMDFAL